MSAAKRTTDHRTIRRWVEERGGYPARVVGAGHPGEGEGILRIDFPGYSGEETLERIDWSSFFRVFEDSELAFLYQEETGQGRQSRFNKLISRRPEEESDEEEEYEAEERPGAA
ncbi:MAG TPA: hypothetical protein VKZ63_06685 [Kofleriaceae bacterium]|nr:hypothetical protein [Kofleriaceae bacterium]